MPKIGRFLYICSYIVTTMKRKPIQMKMEGYEVVEKKADKGGNSGRIYVPKHCIGKKVRAVLIEYKEKNEKS